MKAVIVTYIVKKGSETKFEKILREHWKALKQENLVTPQVPFLLRDPENPSVYKEIFEWQDSRSLKRAEKSEKIQKIWKRMTDLTIEGGIEPANFKRL